MTFLDGKLPIFQQIQATFYTVYLIFAMLSAGAESIESSALYLFDFIIVLAKLSENERYIILLKPTP